MHRYTVPVDDRPHLLQLTGRILHVAKRDRSSVEVWAYASAGPAVVRRVQVFGTGQQLPNDVTPERHLGTAITPGGHLVWHLFEVPA